MTLLLRGATLADGVTVDVRLGGHSVAAVDRMLSHEPEDEVLDLTGFLLLPAPAEPHAHLDKALTADLVSNPAGDLLGAIHGWSAACPAFAVEEVAARARVALLRLVASGCTAVRSHVDVGTSWGLRGVEALVGVRAELGHVIDLQLVALTAAPADPGLLRAAIDLGVDVVGGCPHLDDDPLAALETAVGTAVDRGLPLDLHVDETLDPDVAHLRDLARMVTGAGLAHVTASHCVSLGVQDRGLQVVVAEELAAAGISVVTLPATNLFLQARGITSSPPRGLTAIRPLLEAGVNVAAGADNLQDPFCSVGRADPLETAALLVMAGHLPPVAAYAAVSGSARLAMGLPAVGVEAGSPAELLAVRSTSIRAAVADAPPDRMVFAKGRLVSQTTSERTYPALQACRQVPVR